MHGYVLVHSPALLIQSLSLHIRVQFSMVCLSRCFIYRADVHAYIPVGIAACQPAFISNLLPIYLRNPAIHNVSVRMHLNRPAVHIQNLAGGSEPFLVLENCLLSEQTITYTVSFLMAVQDT